MLPHLDALHYRHKGEACWILGSGASLRRQPLRDLEGKLTFAASRLVLWEECPFVPTYHLLTEWAHISDKTAYYWDGVKERFLVTQRALYETGWTYVPKAPQEDYLIVHGTKGLGNTFEPFTNGRSSAITALQLAAWMGCARFYILGCETTLEGHAWDPGSVRNDVRPEKVMEAWSRVLQDVTKAERRIWDCTPFGNLSKHGVLNYLPLEVSLVEG